MDDARDADIRGAPANGTPTGSGAGDRDRAPTDVALGVRPNVAQFLLLVLVTVFIGSIVGLERTVVPLMAGRQFGVESAVITMSFITAFGATKAVANFVAGWLSDRRGRRTLLIVGWIAALPVPVMLAFAPTWGWVIFANLFLGVSQGLTWTMTLVMMSDVAGRRRRGLVIGVNELTGYVAIALATLVSVPAAETFGTRTSLAVIGMVVAIAGLASSLWTRETSPYARAARGRLRDRLPVTWRALPRRVLVPRRHPELIGCYQAGLVTKINDAGTWGLVPLLLAARGFPATRIALVAAVYPLVWGLGQGLTGALSDVADRRPLVVAGMAVQAAGLGVLAVAGDVVVAVAASATLGVGTALVYPTLLAAVRDIADGRWEASAFGAYRLWRDVGFVVGALGIGALADAIGMGAALVTASVVSAASALVSLRLVPRHLAAFASRRADPSTLAPPARAS